MKYLRLLAAPICGTVMTVAVAWGCAIWSPATAWSTHRAQLMFALSAPPPPGERTRASFFQGEAGFGYTKSHEGTLLIDHTEPQLDVSATVDQSEPVETAGWPVRCLRATTTPAVLGGTERSGLAIPARLPRQQPGRQLPIEPIWPGLLIDTLLYSLVIAAVLHVGALRRLRRRHRRLCPACGYPRGASERCSECGAADGRRAR